MLTCHFGFVSPSSPVCWFANWPPYWEAKERPKDEADHSKLVGSSFNKRENVQTRLVLGGHTRAPPPARMLKAYIEA